MIEDTIAFLVLVGVSFAAGGAWAALIMIAFFALVCVLSRRFSP